MSARSELFGPTTNRNGQWKSTELADPVVVLLELLPDAALVRQAQAGDHEALDLLLRRHRQGLLDHTRQHCGNCFLAEDLCQETCLSLVSHLSELRQPEAFAGWLRTSLIRAAGHCRKKNCRKSGTPSQEDASYIIEGLSVEAPWSTEPDWQGLWNVLWDQIGVMDGRLREAAAIMLAYYDQHEEFPSVRALAEATRSSHGAAERSRAAVLCAWRRTLTALNLYL